MVDRILEDRILEYAEYAAMFSEAKTAGCGHLDLIDAIATLEELREANRKKEIKGYEDLIDGFVCAFSFIAQTPDFESYGVSAARFMRRFHKAMKREKKAARAARDAR